MQQTIFRGIPSGIFFWKLVRFGCWGLCGRIKMINWQQQKVPCNFSAWHGIIQILCTHYFKIKLETFTLQKELQWITGIGVILPVHATKECFYAGQDKMNPSSLIARNNCNCNIGPNNHNYNCCYNCAALCSSTVWEEDRRYSTYLRRNAVIRFGAVIWTVPINAHLEKLVNSGIHCPIVRT